MHIAICDDNIADRKQLERLLGRESDRRKTDTGVFFCDSYGNTEQLRHNPMPYELFFLDMVANSPNGLEFALELGSLGVTAPIVLCVSKLPYREMASRLSSLPENILFLEKPIKTAELASILDHAIQLNANRVSTIELRNDKETRYVFAEDILYVTGSSSSIHAHLADHADFPILTTSVENFFSTISMYPDFVLLNEHNIINLSHVENFHAFRICFDDGTSISSSPFIYSLLKKTYRNYLSDTKSSQ